MIKALLLALTLAAPDVTVRLATRKLTKPELIIEHYRTEVKKVDGTDIYELASELWYRVPEGKWEGFLVCDDEFKVEKVTLEGPGEKTILAIAPDYYNYPRCGVASWNKVKQ